MTRVGRPLAMPIEERKEAIYAAAETLFGQRGYEKVTMAEIAGAAGMSKKTLYQHFSDKESLLRDLVSASYIWPRDAFEVDHDEPVKSLRHRLRVVARHVLSERHVRLCRLAIGESVGMDGLADTFLKMGIEESRKKLIETIGTIPPEQRRINLPPEILAGMLYGATCGISLMRALLTNEVPPIDQVDATIDTVIAELFSPETR